MTNIMDICSEELKKHGAKKLNSITVRYGILSNVVVDSMEFAFEALTKNTAFEGAKLILNEEKLVLECLECKFNFSPNGKDYFHNPCPNCQEQASYKVLSGEGIFLDRIEAE